ATGDSPLGRSDRGPIPLHLILESKDVSFSPGAAKKWGLILTVQPYRLFTVGFPPADSLPSHLPPKRSNRYRGRLLAACRSEFPTGPTGESDKKLHSAGRTRFP